MYLALSKWELLSLIPMENLQGQLPFLVPSTGLLYWNQVKDADALSEPLLESREPRVTLPRMVSPKLGALSHEHHAPEFWMSCVFSWACPFRMESVYTTGGAD